MVPELLAVEAPERFGVEPVGCVSTPYPKMDFGRDSPFEGDDHGFGLGSVFVALPFCVVDVGQVF